MSEHLTHMRFVHNTHTLIGLAVIYLVGSSWNSGNELHRDLAEFLKTVQLASQIAEKPETLEVLVPEVLDHRASLNDDLSDTLGYPVFATTQPFPIQLLTRFPDKSAPISTQWQELQTQRWLVSRLIAPRNDLEDVRVWLAAWGYCLPVLRRELRRTKPAVRRRFTTPMLFLRVVDDEPTDSSMVPVMVDARVFLPQRRRSLHPCRTAIGETNFGEFARHNDRDLFHERKSFGPYPFAIQRDMIRVPDGTLGRYPYVERALDTIGELAPTQALTWAVEQQQANLRGRDARFFGTSIRGEHLRYVGPAMIFGLHFYMLVTLSGLYSQRRFRLVGPIPWLAAIPSLWTTLFSGLTLVVVPAGALGLILWRLTTVPFIHAAALVAISVGLGVWLVVWARKLGLQCTVSA